MPEQQEYRVTFVDLVSDHGWAKLHDAKMSPDVCQIRGPVIDIGNGCITVAPMDGTNGEEQEVNLRACIPTSLIRKVELATWNEVEIPKEWGA